MAEREGRRGRESPGLDVPKGVPAVVVNGEGGEKGGGESGRATCAGEVMSCCDVGRDERGELGQIISSLLTGLASTRWRHKGISCSRYTSSCYTLLYTAQQCQISATGVTSHSIGQAFRKGRAA